MEGVRGPGQAASEWWVGRSPRALALGAALGHQHHRGGDRGHAEPQPQPRRAGSQQQPAPGGPAGAPRLDRSPVSAAIHPGTARAPPPWAEPWSPEREDARQGSRESGGKAERAEGGRCRSRLLSGGSPGSPASLPRAQGGLGPQPHLLLQDSPLSLPPDRIPKATEAPSPAHAWRCRGPRWRDSLGGGKPHGQEGAWKRWQPREEGR